MNNLKIDIEKIAKQYGILPDYLLGQHFVADGGFLNKMTLGVDDRTVVIEVGPGLGQLTEVLSRRAKKVIAIEVDTRFRLPLIQLQKKFKNIELVFDNALSNVVEDIISRERKLNNKVYVVSNLPYHITEPFINKLAKIEDVGATLMVGKKFGYQARINNPEDLQFSELSYICKSFFSIEKISDVPKDTFWPVPKTDSVILKFIPKPINGYDFLGRFLILGQKHNTLIKNALMNALVELNKSKGINTTKNQARIIINGLEMSQEILNKSFSQLNNDGVRTLASSINALQLT